MAINTSITIITFRVVFQIQNTRNCNSRAVQLKPDELIRATQSAHNSLMDTDEQDERTFDAFHMRNNELAARSRALLQRGYSDIESPEP